MKKIISTMLAMSCGAFCYAYDTYFFRVPVDDTVTKNDVESYFESRGVKSSPQPFYGTYTLTQPDTNYVLVKITPSDDSEWQEVKTNFNTPGIELYQTWNIDEFGVHLLTDNSFKYPTDYDWSIKRSSD